MSWNKDVSNFAPWILSMLCILIIVFTLSGCMFHSKELTFCREYVPKCDAAIQNCGIVIDEQKAELEFNKVQIGLCNDLNQVLMENKTQKCGDSIELKPGKVKVKYLGNPRHTEKS